MAVQWPYYRIYKHVTTQAPPFKAKTNEPLVLSNGRLYNQYWSCCAGKPYVNRGIGGQTTPQILVRMFPDVINLKPAAMILLAGTNDIARNTGPTTHRPPKNRPASPGRHPETQRLAERIFRKIRRRLRRLLRRLRRRKGLLENGFSGDGLHPNAKGYELMAPIADAAIRKALGR